MRILTIILAISGVSLGWAKASARTDQLKLVAYYDCYQLAGDSESYVSITAYLENWGESVVKVFKSTSQTKSANGELVVVFSINAGRRFDGKILKPPEGAFDPVILKPGEVTKLPEAVFNLGNGTPKISKPRVVYRVGKELGDIMEAWSGELTAQANPSPNDATAGITPPVRRETKQP
jgi:hypothetical protein